jgi:hypothetical protein
MTNNPTRNEAKAALALWTDHVRTIVEGGESKVVTLRTCLSTIDLK